MTELLTANSRFSESAEDFARHEHCADATRIVTNLAYGLNLLRDALFERIHVDVQRNFGVDSMLIPASLIKSEARTKQEIDVYLVVEAADEITRHQYLKTTGPWFMQWLTELQFGHGAAKPQVTQRIDELWALDSDQRRLAFSTILERAFPEARKAPLIVYQLLPLAAGIVAAMAFDNMPRAAELRRRQKSLLPAIGDCRECHGDVLECGESCRQCGNPLWKFKWLVAE